MSGIVWRSESHYGGSVIWWGRLANDYRICPHFMIEEKTGSYELTGIEDTSPVMLRPLGTYPTLEEAQAAAERGQP